MKFNTRKAVIAMFSISVLVIVVLNFGISDNQQQVMETQYLIDTIKTPISDTEKQYEKRLAEKVLELERKSVIKDTLMISEPMLLEPESTVRVYKEMPIYDEPETRNTSSEQQVIVVQMPAQQQLDWKSLISWAVAALNGVVLLVMNIKNLKKK